jgi:hypothetical protein
LAKSRHGMSLRVPLALNCHRRWHSPAGASRCPNRAPSGLDRRRAHSLDEPGCASGIKSVLQLTKNRTGVSGAMSLRHFRRGCTDSGAGTHR